MQLAVAVGSGLFLGDGGQNKNSLQLAVAVGSWQWPVFRRRWRNKNSMQLAVAVGSAVVSKDRGQNRKTSIK